MALLSAFKASTNAFYPAPYMPWHYYLRLKHPRMPSIQHPICCGIITECLLYSALYAVALSPNAVYTAPYMLWHYYLCLKRPRMSSIQRPICCGIITECLLYSALYAVALLSAFKASTNVFYTAPYMLWHYYLRLKRPRMSSIQRPICCGIIICV